MSVPPALEATRRPCATIRLSRHALPLSPLRSKLGGIPYVPEGWEPPLDSDGNPMCVLAQIDLAGTDGCGLLGLPCLGLLQLWISRTVGVYGLCFKHGEKGFEAVFHPAPDLGRQRVDASDFAVAGDTPPFEGEIACDPEPATCLWTGVDETMNSEEFSEDELEEIYDQEGPHHRMGGWSFFTQSDPRPGNSGMVLLWQVDSDDGVGLMWGDAGVANAFIPAEDLAANPPRFDRILWNWDCC